MAPTTHRSPTPSTTKRAHAASSKKKANVHIRRAYDEPSEGEGYRVLVDRLWPRGIRKEHLAIDEWLRELGPSNELRRWFGHDPARWEEFVERYRHELEADTTRSTIEALARRALKEPLTLLYGAHDTAHNQAIVLSQEISRAAAKLSSPKVRS
jgi:uncharacterized protein YeaO (DUF488 family)